MDVRSGELFRKAERLGIVRNRPVVLYTQPRYITINQGTWQSEMGNCLSIAVEQIFRSLDSQTSSKKKGWRNYITWILSLKLHSLVVVDTKINGWSTRVPQNHVSRILIWASDESTINLIIHHLILAQNGDPIREGIDWKKIEKEWEIVKHRAIYDWKKHLEKFSPTTIFQPSPAARDFDESFIRICEKCGSSIEKYSLFCSNCGFGSES
ncbi:MAG: zinc ribbon domain-containing protein [Candidatus Hermodarchaeota archaeon]